MNFPLWGVLPFIVLILVIAIFPLAVPNWWEKYLNKTFVSLLLGLPIAILLVVNNPDQLWHTLGEYLSFMILIGSLFVISGGIFIKGSLAGTPLGNTLFLAAGSILANFIGTTGASMVLIRPLLRANAVRKDKRHIVIFFIFLVSNIGGCLTPLGDPPIFMGFLRGVPFEWTLNLLPMWLFMTVGVLVLFNLYDQYKFNREELLYPEPLMKEVQPKRVIKILGKRNGFFLFCIIGIAFCSGKFHFPRGSQEIGMVLVSLLSLKFTPKEYRKANNFTMKPIIEVGILFAGLFITMVPLLLLLNSRGGELGLTAPWQYFWVGGALSSFLDNTPTYLIFSALACGVVKVNCNNLFDLIITQNGKNLLMAISCGTVFWGAMTYIGNAPNFMVRIIAEEHYIKMPSFFGYMLFSLCILIPLFILCSLLFFV